MHGANKHVLLFTVAMQQNRHSQLSKLRILLLAAGKAARLGTLCAAYQQPLLLQQL